ncbi:MAG: hypothetical protein A4S09_00905 [Proteobacteria bacterium SG_bin7]|nr:MAG: hypothetical protein A4S09_00905 [Proteobacteria bacterium SG_bin7]
MPSPDLAKQIHERFKFRRQSIAAAESCTGGAFTAELVRLPGASDFVKGSVVAYSNSSKVNVLQVKKSTLDASGAVSQEVALQMAKGVKQKLESTWSVGITGIAGPTGGSKDKPIGTVCIAVIGPGFEYSEINLFTGSREAVIESTVKRTMQLVLEKTH